MRYSTHEPRRLTLTSQFHLGDLPGSIFSADVVEQELREIRFAAWATSLRTLGDEPPAEAQFAP